MLAQEQRRRITAVVPEFKADFLGRLGRSQQYANKCEVAVLSIAHWCGWERVSDINAKSMLAWINHQAEAGNGGEGAHPQTIKNHLSMMRAFTGYLVASGELTHDPLMTVRSAPVRAGDRGDGAHPFTLEEMRALVAQALGQEEEAHQSRRHGRRSALYLAMGTMGLRRAEAHGVVWADVDLRQGWLKIRKDKSRRGDRMPIPWELALVLGRERIERANNRHAPLGANKPVFPATDHNTLIKDMEAAGIERKPGLWHRWRKGFITYVAMRSDSDILSQITRQEDGKPTASSTMARHTSSAITSASYVRPSDEALEALAYAVTPTLLPESEVERLKKLLATSDLILQPGVSDGTLGSKRYEGEPSAAPTREYGVEERRGNRSRRMTPPGFDLPWSQLRRRLNPRSLIRDRSAPRTMAQAGLTRQWLSEAGARVEAAHPLIEEAGGHAGRSAGEEGSRRLRGR
ncbi:MAG: tyrosine-type recombinase/integrase [Phycisphaerales bacterium JB064]